MVKQEDQVCPNPLFLNSHIETHLSNLHMLAEHISLSHLLREFCILPVMFNTPPKKNGQQNYAKNLANEMPIISKQFTTPATMKMPVISKQFITPTTKKTPISKQFTTPTTMKMSIAKQFITMPATIAQVQEDCSSKEMRFIIGANKSHHNSTTLNFLVCY